MQRMDKKEAIRRAGGRATHLALLLGVTVQAVSKWRTIPQLRVYQLRELRPEWFRGRK
jgi:hypothetical protein